MSTLDDKLKQRLVGVMVLVALAIIFLPSLFHRNERVVIDTTSQIPPAPEIDPVVIPQPTKPTGIETPSEKKLFRPSEQPKEEPAVSNQTKSESPKPAPPKLTPPKLTERGVPAGWVVQVASFKSADSASALTDKLLSRKLPAYKKVVDTPQGQFVRVYVGPYIDQNRANTIKKQIDKKYQVKSQVVRFNPIAGN